MLNTIEPRATTPSSTREKLRVATAAAHARIDSAACRFDLTKRSNYSAFLSAQAAVLIPLEQMLAGNGVVNILPDWSTRSRSAALLKDLEILHADLRVIPVPDFPHEAEMFGVLYVLEGSRLGARVILRGVDEAAMSSATHFLRHGQASLWPTFLAALENSATVNMNFAATLDAALSTFETFAFAFELERRVAA